MLQQAVKLTPDKHPVKPLLLNNLGTALSYHFERLRDISDINEAILVTQQGVKLSPDGHPDKPKLLTNLGRALLYHFEQLGDLEDINKSVTMLQKALELTPDSHKAKSASLNNLGNSLTRRFQQLGNISDINEPVLMFQQAMKLTPDGHPDKAAWVTNLGSSLFCRFQQLQNPDDHDHMISHYMSAACSSTGPAIVRFHAASMWAKHAQSVQHPSLLHAYSIALGLLPDLAWLGLSISDRHHHILRASWVVRAAAAAAITADQYPKAVEWLEQGRSVIWGQLLNLRTPIDALKETYPVLAEKLLSLSMQLEGAGTCNHSPYIKSLNEQPGTLQATAQQYHENAHARDMLLKEIRELDGFEKFLLPKTISELSLAAEGGPVVILNISESRSDALILMPGLTDNVLHISLLDFTIEEARNLVESLTTLVHTMGRGERLSMQREGHPVLDGLGITTPSKENLQRIWWCPTGLLSFLPIHAAGVYGDNETFGSKLSDFVISSYAPSLTALIQGFRAKSLSPEGLQLLAVAQSSAVGQAYIPGTHEELDHIERLALASGNTSVLQLEQDAATVESVQQGMKDSRWLTLSSIIKLSLPHANFAFLSACQTATGALNLEEESVHLAAGMLVAGYQGVIATMWSIMDNDAPQVAADVYEHLFKTSPPDPTRAAEALHLAVTKLREESGRKKSFFHWVPFIHVGV
ncbi:CHAT domain-containing protein [Mycena epipterygia]|nr:CHAT domain-containing protein [Mycena epipterygia]